jgi:hypothetical protein
MKKNNLLFVLSFLSFTLVLAIASDGIVQAAEPEEPPIAVVIKSPSGIGKGKIKTKKRAIVVAPQPECCAPKEPAPMVCPELEECALTVKEAESKKNDLILSFALTFSSLRSSGLNQFNLASWLESPLSAGFMLSADYYPSETFSVFSDFSFAGTGFSNAQPGVILVQADKTRSSWNMGIRYDFAKHFNTKVYLGVQEDYTLYIDRFPFAMADEFWHGVFGTGLGYNIWQNRRIGFSGVTGFEIYLPGSKTIYTINTGFEINSEIRVTLKYRPELFVAFRYEYSKLKTNTFTDQGQSYYLFAFGVDLKSKFLKQDYESQN